MVASFSFPQAKGVFWKHFHPGSYSLRSMPGKGVSSVHVTGAAEILFALPVVS